MPSTAEELFYHAARYSQRGRHADAVEAYSQSLQLAESWTAAENLGIALSDLDRHAESAAAFQRAVGVAPTRSEAYSLLARTLFEGGLPGGHAAFSSALELDPSSAALHYEIARTDQLFDGTGDDWRLFASAQQLAHAEWRRRMGCSPLPSPWAGGPTRWTAAAEHATGAVRRARYYSDARESGAVQTYGRTAPRPYSIRDWPRNARLSWPSLRFIERSIIVAELHDVWISGNDGVVSDASCSVYLPSHGFQVPLHLNLPHDSVEERMKDGSIRVVGVHGEGGGESDGAASGEGGGGESGGGGAAAEPQQEVLVFSLTQLFAANFYSFVADGLARLVIAIDALAAEPHVDGQPRRKLLVGLPADRSRLKPWMWALLDRLGIGKDNSFPYSVRPYDGSTNGMARAAAARVRAARLLVVDWQEEGEEEEEAGEGDGRAAASATTRVRVGVDGAASHAPTTAAISRAGSAPQDLAHLPPRAALRLLRERLAFPGAHLAWVSPRRSTVVYLQRAAASIRRVANEAALLTALGRAAGAAAAEVRLLSDAPTMSLADTQRLLSRAVAVVGVHGAGWTNLLFCGDGAHAIEMALPEPHAVYAAHMAYALGLHYHLVPLRGVSLHSAELVQAPVRRVEAAVSRALSSSAAAPEEAPEEAAEGAVPLSVELVVARYREDVAWCAEFNATVYNKGGEASPPAALRDAVGDGRLRWHGLPNVGRESHTWLWHIVSRWDQLADWTVFMQGDPTDHLPAGLSVGHYLNATTSARRRDAFFPLTAAAAPDLEGLAFRTGYAPFAPFSGELVGPPGGWAEVNRARLPLLLQPLGLWSGQGESETEGYGYGQGRPFANLSLVELPRRRLDAGLSLLHTELFWIKDRQAAQGDRGLVAFWRRLFGSEPPSRLYHAQGAQFGVSAAAVHRRERGFYVRLLEELQRLPDPVASYYCELVWWYVFDEGAEAAMGW